MMTSPRDAVVVGGALAGSLAALALARFGLHVTLVEARPAPPRKSGRDGRSISLSLASVRVFESLGLWSSLAPEATPITTVHVSEAGRFGRMRLAAGDMHVAALGQVVPAEALLAAIGEAADAAGVERLSPATVEATSLSGDVRRVAVRREGERFDLDTRLLVAADGAGSTLREALGIDVRTHAYDATAWVTTARAAHPQAGVAFERFTREGILAILPRPGDKVGVVWTLDAERDDDMEALETDAFLERVGDALGGRLGSLQPAAAVRHFPLAGVRAEAQTAERAVVIGNAAHALHPVAAQGFNLTVRDIAELVQCVDEADRDPGDPDVLRRYVRARRRDQARTEQFTGLARCIGDWRTPLGSHLRSRGFLVCDLMRPLARGCTLQGMGLRPRPLPSLVRGARL